MYTAPAVCRFRNLVGTLQNRICTPVAGLVPGQAAGAGFCRETTPAGLTEPGPNIQTEGVVCRRGAGSAATLEQAGERAEDSCRFFGLAAGGGLRLRSLVGSRGRDSALGR